MKQYEMLELVYQAPAPEGSQADVDLTAKFICGGETVAVKGFYAGQNTYKVRFLPMQAGNYTYHVSGVLSDDGQLRILPADRHGPVHARGCHFCHADGMRYSPFGTTVYALAHQDGQTTHDTFESLENAPFNKVRLCLFPKHYEHNSNDPKLYAFEKDMDGNWDVHHPCFAFWDAFEDKLRKLDDLGIQADLILFHSYDRWGFSRMGQEANLVYLDYLLRRFSAFPHIWWSLANEYDLMYNMTMEDWMEIEDFVAENDPYSHLLSNHNCFALWDASRSNITHASLQTRQLTRIAEWRDAYHKPVVVDECCYEGNLSRFWGCISGREMVRRFWRVAVTGGYCTHGETFLDPQRDVIWWAKGGRLKGESASRIAFLRGIVEALPGPIDPMSFWLADVYQKAVGSGREQETAQTDPGYAAFIQSFARLGREEAAAYLATEFSFMGRCGDEAFIIYYDLRCCAEDTLELPKDKSYRIELYDVWNMTCEVIAEHVCGRTQIHLPAKEDMAVVALADKPGRNVI